VTINLVWTTPAERHCFGEPAIYRCAKNRTPEGTTSSVARSPGSRLSPPAPLTGDVGRDCGDAGRALLFACCHPISINLLPHPVMNQTGRKSCARKNRFLKNRRWAGLQATLLRDPCFEPPLAQATLGARLRELRWKNSAWLATADTIAGWNGFEIRNAGSGRSPVRKRSG
jgi:hypothetical protein